jgi:lysophospholipase L1-like esterase
MQIYCFGDSITEGCWDEQGGWVDRLKRRLYAGNIDEGCQPPTIFNLGVSGQRSDHLLKRIAPEIEYRTDDGEERMIFIQVGANDATYIPEQHTFKTPPEAYRNNIVELIKKAQMYSSRITMLTITPVNESVTMAGEKVRRNEYVVEYNNLISDVARQQGVTILDIYTAFQVQGPNDLLCADGLHPNSGGHALICDMVFRNIQ